MVVVEELEEGEGWGDGRLGFGVGDFGFYCGEAAGVEGCKMLVVVVGLWLLLFSAFELFVE